ncbi:protein PTHB1-like isoform X2 [Amphiura filiformis]|uniref:protein PTHB1-like isoform X2 n=1 Tax=Amphiura filiformis TaxID=82378 RepID=UPI003B221CCB
MSLFKARDWWAASVGSDEVFDQGSLCVANIDNNSTPYDKVIVGSFNGILRIYQPRPAKGENFKAEDVMLEVQMQFPILQLAAGRFVSVSEALHLAVLHPRKLAVYSVSGSTGAVEHGSQYQLKLIYEHNLQRTAYNLVIGPFGGVKGKDFMCVQSMDGTVSFFEQESFAFSRFLPGFLLPGPLQYLQRTDSFVTVSSSWQVESYKYQVLAVATDAKTKEESQNLKSGKRINMDWSYNLGEPALDLAVVSFPQTPPSIIVLGERSIVCLKDTGALRFMKKLEYNPSCFFAYTALTDGVINYMVGTHTGQVMVYQDIALKWAAKLEYIPVSIRVGFFQDLKGVITTIDDQGHLVCSYLGTDPSIFVAPSTDAREINYDDQDAEMKNLNRMIKEQMHKTDMLPTPKTGQDEVLEIQVSVPNSLDSTSVATETEVQDDEDPIPSITVRISLKCKGTSLQDVHLLISCPYPLAANQSNFSFPFVDPSTPTQVLVSFFMRGNSLPSNLNFTVSATYLNQKGSPRVVQTSSRLPVKLVVKACAPVKTATHKITVDSNKNAVNLNDIFPDLLGPNAGGAGNAIGLQIIGGPKVTILASKTSQRYRLQCDVFEGMWLVLKEFLERVCIYQRNVGVKDFEVSYTGQLPLQEYFELIDTHVELRLNGERYKSLLDQRAKQFRAIQRRLLTRFKDKTPAPLANLDTLLDGTYRQILKLADGLEEGRKALVRCSLGLSCATSILNTMLRLMYNLTDSEFKVLENGLSPHVQIDGEQGWEESVDASISQLLRTCLAKSAKDQAVNPSPLTMTTDPTKLKKHIAQMCERLAKGARLVVDGQKLEERSSPTKTRKMAPQSSSRDFFDQETASTPSRRPESSKHRTDTNQNGPEPIRMPESKPVPSPIDTHQPPPPTVPPPYGSEEPTSPSESVSSPRSSLGDLPPLGGPGVRGSALPPLGGHMGEGGANPALPAMIKPTKKKKKKKTPRSPKETDSASLEGDDPFFNDGGKSGSPEPLSVM